MKTLFLSLLIAGLLLIAPTGAQAVTVKNFIDTDSNHVDMGTIFADYKGTIDTKTTGGKGNGEHRLDWVNSGSLSSNTQIVFTYELSGVTSVADWLINGSIGGITPPGAVSDWTAVTSPTGSILSYIATLTLANFTDTDKSIWSYVTFNGTLPGTAALKTTYETSLLSAVPLPAALPLFGAGFAGLVGLKRARKSKAAV